MFWPCFSQREAQIDLSVVPADSHHALTQIKIKCVDVKMIHEHRRRRMSNEELRGPSDHWFAH